MAVPEDAQIVEANVGGAERFLNVRERAAYDWTIKQKTPRLSPDTQARLFALFVQGTDCVKIAELNKGITLGQICIARVEGNWDEKRQEHTEALLKETRQRLQQTTLESIDFLTTQIAAAHKQYGDKAKRFLQTGDPAELGGFSIHGWKAYREAVELLKQVTGADNKEKKISVDHTHRVEPSTPVPAANRAMTPAEAREVRKDFLKRQNDK